MQQNASTEYKSARNKEKQLYKAFWVTRTALFMWKLALFYIRLKRGYYLYSFCRIHIFLYLFYVWISFNGFTIDSLENYQVFKQKPFPLFVKTHKFAQNNYFFMTSDVSDRKLRHHFQNLIVMNTIRLCHISFDSAMFVLSK
jgi:hypothetical protein